MATLPGGIIHQHYRVTSVFPRAWQAQCKVCRDATGKGTSPEQAEQPMLQHLRDKHGIEATHDNPADH